METKITTLDNGLRVASTRMDLKSMTAMIFVGAGSRYEDPAVGGISHFLEHLFFKGTPRRPTTLDISSEVDAMGAQFNAYTAKEYTGYWIRGAAAVLEPSLDILSDMLRNALLAEAEIERERGVILEEIKLYEDTPQRRVFELFDRVWFGDQPLGRPIIGTPEVIRALSREDFLAYRQRLYAPERMLVCVAGGIEHQQVVDLSRRLLGDLAPLSTSDPSPAGAHAADSFGLVRKPILQSHFALGLPGLGARDERLPALELLLSVLGGNMSSRLFIRVREREGLCYAIRSSAVDYSDTGYVVVYAGTDPDKARKALDITLEEIRRVASEAISPAELERARAYLKGMTVLSLEDSRSVAGKAARDLVVLGRVRSIEEELALLDSVTIDQVSAVAGHLLQESEARLAVVGPFDDASAFAGVLPTVA